MTNQLSEKAKRVLALVRSKGGEWIRYNKNAENLAAVTELANAGLIDTNGNCEMRERRTLSVVS